jgi:hypothetical protein
MKDYSQVSITEAGTIELAQQFTEAVALLGPEKSAARIAVLVNTMGHPSLIELQALFIALKDSKTSIG